MRREPLHLSLATIVLFAVVCVGCTAPQRYRDIAPGATSNEVLSLLGRPDDKKLLTKPANDPNYFGQKASAAYLALPEGTLVEIWSYRYFRETWSYVFNLEEDPPTVVHTGYDHPSIIY
jgi:hypothetical protein